MLNSLLGRKGLARTSNTPGRTQSINYFLINEMFYFVDLPGYGYAKVSKAMRAGWGKMAEEYLSHRQNLVLSIQLIDFRHEPTVLDKQLNEWLVANRKPFVVVATKSDKLSSNQRTKQLRTIEDLIPESHILTYSTISGKGRDKVWGEINKAIG